MDHVHKTCQPLNDVILSYFCNFPNNPICSCVMQEISKLRKASKAMQSTPVALSSIMPPECHTKPLSLTMMTYSILCDFNVSICSVLYHKWTLGGH